MHTRHKQTVDEQHATHRYMRPQTYSRLETVYVGLTQEPWSKSEMPYLPPSQNCIVLSRRNPEKSLELFQLQQAGFLES